MEVRHVMEQVQCMIDWIEDHLKDRFSLDELSDYMGYSPYYCSFKFHQVTGVSIKRYILLRRLYLSTEDLSKNKRIIDVAFTYGYSSQEAYSRAFKRVFGINPGQYQMKKVPVQSIVKLTTYKNGAGSTMNVSRKIEVNKVKNERSDLFDKNILHIMNGQLMYDEFKTNKLLGDADYAPFNEAMCVNKTTEEIFNHTFIRTRADGHNESEESYMDKVIVPLHDLFNKEYTCIVLWFGEDMFCQMNVLTVLSYLEQTKYKGKVFLNSFREDEFKVNQTELTLGHYHLTYKETMIHHVLPSNELMPIMYQAIKIYLDMLKAENEVVKYIRKNKDLPTKQLIQTLFHLFPTIGYGDSQYIELINKIK